MVTPDCPCSHCEPCPQACSAQPCHACLHPLLRLLPPPVLCRQLHHGTGFSTVEGPFLPTTSLHQLFASFLTLITAVSTCLLVFLLPPLNYVSSRTGPSLSCISRIYTAPGYCNLKNYRMSEKKNQQLNFECRINEWMKLWMLRIQDPLFELCNRGKRAYYLRKVIWAGAGESMYTSSRCFSGD